MSKSADDNKNIPFPGFIFDSYKVGIVVVCDKNRHFVMILKGLLTNEC